jgi:hypothetical protein
MIGYYQSGVGQVARNEIAAKNNLLVSAASKSTPLVIAHSGCNWERVVET